MYRFHGLTVSLLAASLLFAGVLRAAGQPKLAVLEFKVAEDGLNIDRPTFSARLQNAARRAAPGVFVMTEENIETLIQAAGRSLADCEGLCAVDTGRLIGADVVITGRIARIGATLSLTLQMYETSSGRLLAGEDVTSRDPDGLLTASEGATERLLVALARTIHRDEPVVNGADGHVLQQTARLDLGQQDARVEFVSTPPGAVVDLDGTLLCHATPCAKLIGLGLHEVIFQKEGWETSTLPLRVPETSKVETKMLRSTALIGVTTSPSGLGIEIDSRNAGASPLAAREFAPGPHQIVISDRCWQRDGENRTFKMGEDATISLLGRPRMAGLRVTAEDGTGNSLAGSVWIDGVELGAVPGRYELPLCSKKIEVHASGGRSWTDDLDLKEGKVASITASLPMPEKPNLQRRTAVGFGVAAGAAAIVGGVFTVRSYNAAADWQNAATYQSWADSRDRANSSSTAATVSFIAAGVLLTTGVLLWMLSEK